MAKCDLCGEKIALTFLNKVRGTIVRDSNHKKRHICPHCQQENSDKDIKTLLK
jgi:hypothetical protein